MATRSFRPEEPLQALSLEQHNASLGHTTLTRVLGAVCSERVKSIESPVNGAFDGMIYCDREQRNETKASRTRAPLVNCAVLWPEGSLEDTRTDIDAFVDNQERQSD